MTGDPQLSKGLFGDPIDLLKYSADECEMVLTLLSPLFRARGRSVARARASALPPGTQMAIMLQNQRGDMLGTFVVYLVSISARSIAFLHGAFVHDSVQCALKLVTADGESIMLQGAVSGCRHVRARGHEVSVEFASRIDVEALFSLEESESDAANSPKGTLWEAQEDAA